MALSFSRRTVSPLWLLVVAGSISCGGDLGEQSSLLDAQNESGDDRTEVPETRFPRLCGTCHRAEGQGGLDGPEIRNPVPEFARFVVRNGRDEMPFRRGMPAFDREDLSDEELDAILAFLASAQKPRAGDDLFSRFCGNCHGKFATGGRTGRSLRNPVPSLDEWISQVRSGSNAPFDDSREYMPSWTASELSDEEIEQMYDFISAL